MKHLNLHDGKEKRFFCGIFFGCFFVWRDCCLVSLGHRCLQAERVWTMWARHMVCKKSIVVLWRSTILGICVTWYNYRLDNKSVMGVFRFFLLSLNICASYFRQLENTFTFLSEVKSVCMSVLHKASDIWKQSLVKT